MEQSRIIIKEYRSIVGELILGSYDNQLCLCDWKYRKMRQKIDNRIQSQLNCEYGFGESDVLMETISQLERYFDGKLKDFEIPILTAGTPFQKSVWDELLNIKYGQIVRFV